MNERVFLEAIAAEPDELAHRLVYADWLEEQGSPRDQARAEFIRLQVERAALPPAHPRARALQRREDELLQRHGGEWSAEVAPLVRHWQFHRGFIEAVRLTVEQLVHNGQQLLRLAPVRRMQLRCTSALPAILSHSPGSARVLADVLSRLEVLDLNREHLGEAAGLALLELPTLPKLKALHLGHNSLSAAGVQVLAESPVLAGLRALEFTGSVESLQALLHSPRLTSLRELSLAGGRLGDRVGRLLAGSGLLGRLRGLSLAHAQMSATGLAALVGSPAAEGLEELDLSFNPLGVEGARVLARSLPRLGELNLSRTRLGNEGAAILAESGLLSRLRALDLSLDQVGPEGGLALAGGERLPLLMKLDLIYNPLGQEAREALLQRFGADVCLFNR